MFAALVTALWCRIAGRLRRHGPAVVLLAVVLHDHRQIPGRLTDVAEAPVTVGPPVEIRTASEDPGTLRRADGTFTVTGSGDWAVSGWRCLAVQTTLPGTGPAPLGPWAGLGVLAAWAGAALAVGWAGLWFRDA